MIDIASSLFQLCQKTAQVKTIGYFLPDFDMLNEVKHIGVRVSRQAVLV